MGKFKRLGWINESVTDVIKEMHGCAKQTSYNTRMGKMSGIEKAMRLRTCGLVHMYANRLEKSNDRMLMRIGVTAMEGYVRGTINDKDMALFEIARFCGIRVGKKMGVKK